MNTSFRKKRLTEMALVLPQRESELRECFEIEDLALGRNVVTYPEAKYSARKTFASNKAVKRVFFLAMAPDDELQLISIGPRGGRRVEWKFGYPPANYFNQEA